MKQITQHSLVSTKRKIQRVEYVEDPFITNKIENLNLQQLFWNKEKGHRAFVFWLRAILIIFSLVWSFFFFCGSAMG